MVTIISMSSKELKRLEAIRQLDEGRLTRAQAGQLVGLGVRQMQRLLNAYRQHGPPALVSRKRGRPSNRRYPRAFGEQVVDLIRTHYGDFGPTLASEKLGACHELYVSVPTLRRWMIDAGIWVPRRLRERRVYQPRYRRECFGELIQIDGSEHHWFEDRGPPCTLLVYVDDATGRLLELRFVPSESTFDYFLSTQRYLRRYGKPVAFYSDKHSIFRVNRPGALHGDGMTQFGRALHELNIDIICANSSQAKGRVERVNRTLQDRLVKELRLAGISDMTAANAFLPGYIEGFNARFAKPALQDRDLHRPLQEHEDLDEILCWQEERTVSNSLTLQYDRVLYVLEPDELTRRLRRRKVRIYDFPDGTLDIRYRGRSLPFTVFDKVRQVRQADVVSNKRLSAALQFCQERQAAQRLTRSRKAPARRAQLQQLKERGINPALLSGSSSLGTRQE
jgi:hypothetical protein